jgi:hypothetical protein
LRDKVKTLDDWSQPITLSLHREEGVKKLNAGEAKASLDH